MARGFIKSVGVPSYKWININTSTGGAVFTGPGVVHSVVINKRGTVDSTFFSLWDSTAASGNRIMEVNPVHTASGAQAMLGVIDAECSLGCFVSGGGTTPAEITITYSQKSD